ncbi:cysteine sulfinic acid decarboxylase-like [Mytilus edulis]|uniref:cysteine sulfinic acid decarboxylase-like n=1 Tax=Mytilus edulis TaxID=6550 RepID=UPI0039EFE667
MENGQTTSTRNGVSDVKKLKMERNGATNGANSAPAEDQHHFLTKLMDLMFTEGIDKANDRKNKIVEFKHPKELEKIVDLKLKDPTSDDRLLDICNDVIKYSVKTGHPRFFNQLFGGLDEYTLGGAWLTETLNSSQYTYEVSPVFTLMEQCVIRKMLNFAGLENGDGIFCPGGSISNMYALNVARYQRFPDCKTKGMQALPKICVLTSEKGHYSLKKGAGFLGIGMDNVLPIKTDDQGRMCPKALEETIQDCISKGVVPYMVNATAGSTVLGAYDPLEAIADICEKYKIWMHVDGAWGAGCLLSRKYKGFMKGIERADSLTWNPHKMMGTNLQAAVFLTKHKTVLLDAHSAKAKYLFQQDKFYDVSYDTGDKSIQCGRKVDALKVWTMWKAKGDAGLEEDIDNLFSCSRYLTQLAKARDGFKMVQEPQCTNVCFWYIPERLRGKPETEEWWEQVGKVAPVIKQRMVEKGTLLIGYQPDGDLVNFFRMIFSNNAVTKSDVEFIIDEIDRLGCDL